MIKISLFICATFFASCSFFKSVTKRDKLQINSEPKEALIFNSKNELLGKTPFEMSADEVGKNQSGNFINLTLKAEGYVDLQVIANVNSNDFTALDIKLEKLNGDHFEKWVFNNYKNEINFYSKDLLSVQWLLFSQKYTEARTKIFEINKKYPNVAVIFTMMAQIELQDKKYQQAKLYIEKALQLDAKDVTAIRMLSIVNSYIKENA